MAIPKIILSTAVTVDLHHQAELAAKKQGRTLSRWLRDAIEMKLQFEKFQDRQQDDDNGDDA